MMATSKNRELFIGVVMLGIGLAYLAMTFQLPQHDGIDASFLPYLLSVTLCLLGAVHLLTVFKAPQALEGAGEESETGARPDLKTVLKTLALVVVYIALMPYVGFPIMTVVYLYLQFLVLTPADQRPRHLLYAVIAVATAAVIYVLFREAFDLMLPSGLLDF